MLFPLFTGFQGIAFVLCHPQFLFFYQYFLLSMALSGKGARVFQWQELIGARLPQSLQTSSAISS